MSKIRMIKKYPNRRLYDCLESRYITLEDLRRLAVNRIDFKVEERCSGKDITHSVLLQVVADQERGDDALLGNSFLLDLIRTYGSSMGSQVRGCLEESLKVLMGEDLMVAEEGPGRGSAHL
jgi:polyhydroxyalkanoate synthesis repressor PhaR